MKRLELIAHRLVPYRTAVIGAIHLVLIVLASYTAILLRFDGSVPAENYAAWIAMLPWLVGIRLVTFVPFRLYEGLWRYTSIWDLRNIVAAVGTSTAIFYVVAHLGFRATTYPRSVMIIDAVLLMFFTGGIRLTRRIYRELMPTGQGKTVLIYGAGDAGDMIVREMRHNAFYAYEPVGFIDDDRTKVGRRIRGLPVLGTGADLPRIMAEWRPDEILVAIPTAQPAALRGIVRALEPHKVPIKTLPNLRDVLDGRVSVQQIRSLAVEDLLSRVPVGLHPEPLVDLIAGRRILVTGAGGSIGSELCRQIAALGPSLLVLLDRHENSVYAIENDLAGRGHRGRVRAVVGDVTDEPRVRNILAEFTPDIVFHAAAHKHVPLMELNPCEAVKNNVGGTRVVVRAAVDAGVSRFVLVSTDKAVRPTNVMGATKRVAELIVQDAAAFNDTTFLSVRFGNVLGSNGSVVPRFLEQIAAGGPVTVTHPDVRRYFMLIPEACQLVLHAAARGQGGGIYVLEMGDQIPIVELARDLIRLSGYVPEDIEIIFTGLRPGEKLQEELLGPDEHVDEVILEKIQRVIGGSNGIGSADLSRQLEVLEQAARAEDAAATLQALTAIVPMHDANGTDRALPLPEPSSDQRPVAFGEAAAELAGGEMPVRCPSCRAITKRSRIRSPLERLLKSMRSSRPYRCLECGWRGWEVPIQAISQTEPSAPDTVNLTSMDESARRPIPPAFSPKHLD